MGSTFLEIFDVKVLYAIYTYDNIYKHIKEMRYYQKRVKYMKISKEYINVAKFKFADQIAFELANQNKICKIIEIFMIFPVVTKNTEREHRKRGKKTESLQKL